MLEVAGLDGAGVVVHYSGCSERVNGTFGSVENAGDGAFRLAH
jgi:hypothetical protein